MLVHLGRVYLSLRLATHSAVNIHPRFEWMFAAGHHAANPGISQIGHGTLRQTANKFLSKIGLLEALHSGIIGPQ